ncbi:MAG: hypothetical protein CM1200mP34_0800 [Verrucomicrobiales bacterium]|nr:MAG: hypothetical protein CM1200mP34_0800 [Verrucomicrobiales bacterium]
MASPWPRRRGETAIAPRRWSGTGNRQADPWRSAPPPGTGRWPGARASATAASRCRTPWRRSPFRKTRSPWRTRRWRKTGGPPSASLPAPGPSARQAKASSVQYGKKRGIKPTTLIIPSNRTLSYCRSKKNESSVADTVRLWPCFYKTNRQPGGASRPGVGTVSREKPCQRVPTGVSPKKLASTAAQRGQSAHGSAGSTAGTVSDAKGAQ